MDDKTGKDSLQDLLLEVATNLSLMAVGLLLILINAYPIETIHFSVSKIIGVILLLICIILFSEQGKKLTEGLDIDPMEFSGLALGIIIGGVLSLIWYFFDEFNILFDWLKILFIFLSLYAFHFVFGPAIRILTSMFSQNEHKLAVQFAIQILAFSVTLIGVVISL